ncbi:MAG TPA: carboxypeptidase-like regulatory domain-containing protein [Chryseosolibacter sp.]
MRSSLTLFFFSVVFLCQAQEVVKGIVVDSATFAPLPYVNIQLKSSPRGTTTDANGNFGILASHNDTLILSLVGYERLELPLYDYEAGLIRLAEKVTELKPITIMDSKVGNPYEGMFDEQNAAIVRRKLPFYMSKAKKEKIWFDRLKAENVRVKTYVDLVINDSNTKAGLMKRFSLTEDQYYNTLTKFNERYYSVMYYLTTAELESFLNKFFESEH